MSARYIANSIHRHAQALDVIKFLMIVTIFNLTKVNTVLLPLSLGQRVDDWIV